MEVTGLTELITIPEHSAPREKEKPSEATVREFTETFQRHTALNPKRRNLLIYILVGNHLLDKKEADRE